MAANVKKNNRGDRGSSPEVINNITKKPNTADSILFHARKISPY